MTKTFVIDTNVLLTDPDSLFAFAENEVVLPFTVIEELDKIKSRPNEVGANAREVARRLSDMIVNNEPGGLKRGLKLKNGGTLRIADEADFEQTKRLSKDWDPTNKDNHIMEVCRGLAEQHKKDGKPPPVLVSRDILLRVKCDFLGIACEDYKGTAVVDSVNRLFTGTITADVSDEVIQNYWELPNDETKFEFDVEKHLNGVPTPNEFIILKDPNNHTDESPPVLRFLEPGEPLKVVREVRTPVYGLTPRNLEQEMAIDLLLDPAVKLVTLVGKAGSGKTLVALACGLNQVLEKKRYKTLLVCRPVVPVGNDIGFLPGDKSEKLDPWIAPIKDNLRFLMFSGKKNKGSEMSFQQFFDDGVIEVEAITYLRGRSIANAFILIDECQNLTAHELKTIITRVGENTKIVLTGDIEQIDNLYIDSVSNGLTVAVEKFRPYNISGHVTLVKGERSELATLASKILT